VERPNKALSIGEYVRTRIFEALLETNLRKQEQAEFEVRRQERAEHGAFLRDEEWAFRDISLSNQEAYEQKLQWSQKDKHRKPLQEWQRIANEAQKARLEASLRKQDEMEIREIYLKKQDGLGRNSETKRTRKLSHIVR
jgi:hypothetical protein